MREKGIIFDLDGTLWSTSAQIVPAWNEVLFRKGLPLITVEQMNSFMGKTPDMIASMMLPDIAHEKAMRVFAECVVEEDRYLERHGGVLYQGIEEALSALKKRFFLAIVSNCNEEYLDIFLDYHGMRRYFDDCETYGRTHKQKHDNIRLVIERNSLVSAVYVGDTELDQQSAEKAGIPFIWASYGFGKDIAAEHILQSISELPDTITHVL